MGAVQGVYLKYVGLSALSFVGCGLAMKQYYRQLESSSEFPSERGAARSLFGSANDEEGRIWSMVYLGTAAMLGYSAILNGTIAALFQAERGMGLLGKDPTTGRIPVWSYALFFPFHIPTYIYTLLHTREGSYSCTSSRGDTVKLKVPVASEVQPGWWVGGCYAHELHKDWAGVVDLTAEFPQRAKSSSYLLLPTWDGVPASPSQLERAAQFAVQARKEGDVIVHCAHGRGRSTTVMCASLVKAGLYDTWEEALEKGIQPGRPVCKLNQKMRSALTKWQQIYVTDRKAD